MRARARIIEYLEEHPGLTAIEIGNGTGLWVGTVYFTLWRLENEGQIASYFAPGPYPRRRFYSLVLR